ncbi:unnamed protein product [Peniophora sp. CBMAI 1063]|nr:unnamed protein product [Peniophora sp. CBMAI 1063]
MSGTTEERLSNVFGPRMQADRPLGKEILLCVDIEGMNGLPLEKAWPHCHDVRPSYRVNFKALSDEGSRSISTPIVYEGQGSLQGTVQWNETIYIRCLELSYIEVVLLCSHPDNPARARSSYETCMPVKSFVSATQMPLRHRSDPSRNSCNLFLSVSRVFPEGEEETCDLSTSCLQARHEQSHVDPTVPVSVWNTAFNQMSLLLDTACRWNGNGNGRMQASFLFSPWAEGWLYMAYRDRYSGMEGKDQLDKDLGRVFACTQEFMNVIRQPVARTREPSKGRYIDLTMRAVYSGVKHIRSDPFGHWQSAHERFVAKLTRLAWIIVTPDPPATATDTPTTIAKDAILLVLDAIVRSSDAFPPLKSAASGLLFFATCADMACGNKKQIRDIYKRIHGLAASLKRGTKEGSRITPEHQDAIEVLAADIEALKGDLEGIISERKSRFRRFFSAKRHREELKDVVEQLETSKSNYTTALATLNAMTIADVNRDVRAIALVLDARPVYMPGTRRAQDVTFPNGASRFEEI